MKTILIVIVIIWVLGGIVFAVISDFFNRQSGSKTEIMPIIFWPITVIIRLLKPKKK